QTCASKDRHRSNAKINIRFARSNYSARDFRAAAERAAARFSGKRLSFGAKSVFFRSASPRRRGGMADALDSKSGVSPSCAVTSLAHVRTLATNNDHFRR